jgi:hypothetical protein
MKDTPNRPAGRAVGELDLLRIYAGAAHLHSLGIRPTGELLAELAGGSGPAPVLDALARYGRLTRHQVIAAGAEGFPPALQEVPR